MSVHKAEPVNPDPAPMYNECTHCGEVIKRVPGGHGPTWVHDSTGCVAGRKPKPEPVGFRVVRIVRVAVDDMVYNTATEASEAAHAYTLNHRSAEYAVAHTSYPLETL